MTSLLRKYKHAYKENMKRKVDRALQYPSNSHSNSIKTYRPFTICKEKKDIIGGICMRLQRYESKCQTVAVA